MEETSLNATMAFAKFNDGLYAFYVCYRRAGGLGDEWPILRPRLQGRPAAFREKRARQAHLSRAFRCGDQGQIDDFALRMAAADSGRLMTDGEDRFDGALIVVGREGKHAIDEAPANFGRDLPVLARPNPPPFVERPPQACGVIGLGRTRRGEGAMQIVEGKQMVVDMRHPLARAR